MIENLWHRLCGTYGRPLVGFGSCVLGFKGGGIENLERGCCFVL